METTESLGKFLLKTEKNEGDSRVQETPIVERNYELNWGKPTKTTMEEKKQKRGQLEALTIKVNQ